MAFIRLKMSHCTLDLLKRNPVMQHSLFCLSFHCGTIVDSAGKHRGSLLYVYVHVYRAGTRCSCPRFKINKANYVKYQARLFKNRLLIFFSFFVWKTRGILNFIFQIHFHTFASPIKREPALCCVHKWTSLDEKIK